VVVSAKKFKKIANRTFSILHTVYSFFEPWFYSKFWYINRNLYPRV